MPDPKGKLVTPVGITSDGKIVALLIDDDGHLQIDLLSAPTLTVQSLAGDKIFAYADRLFEKVDQPDAVDGTTDIFTSAVPTGQLWVVQGATAFCTTAALTRIQLGWSPDGVQISTFYAKPSPAAWDPLMWQGILILKAGEAIGARFVGTSAGDDVYLRVYGYVMNAP